MRAPQGGGPAGRQRAPRNAEMGPCTPPCEDAEPRPAAGCPKCRCAENDKLRGLKSGGGSLLNRVDLAPLPNGPTNEVASGVFLAAFFVVLRSRGVQPSI